MHERIRLKDLLLPELMARFEEWGEPAYRGRQLWRWMYRELARSFDDMTDLPARLRERLVTTAELDACWVASRAEARDGSSTKYALRLADGVVIEAVALRYRYGVTACVSSQAGCRMGCRFCASGASWQRNLSSGEIVDQILRVAADISSQRVGRVVIMGVGEPLDNYEQVLRFMRQLHEPAGLGLSYRAITVSTCGLVPEIDRLAREGLPVNLAVSLHAVDDRTRARLMPSARRYPIAELLAAAGRYARATGRQPTLEYTLIDGVNDSLQAAQELGRYGRELKALVNLIPLNPVPGSSYRPSPLRQVRAFRERLRSAGVAVTVRRGLARELEGACGQLRQTATGSGERARQRGQ